jgi:hypothetical protein
VNPAQAVDKETLCGDIRFRTQRPVILALAVADAQEARNDLTLRHFTDQRDAGVEHPLEFAVSQRRDRAVLPPACPLSDAT